MSRRVAAFFDIDRTVLEVNSGTQWTRYQWRTGQMSPFMLARAMGWLVQYHFGLLDFDAMAKKVLRTYAGKPVEPIYEEVERFFKSDVAWAICEEARTRIEEHRRQNHLVVLLTSATRFLSTPVARALEVEHILCTEVEVDDDGRLTGRCLEPSCYGPGKVSKAQDFAQEHDIALERSYFYSDSCSDLPMLMKVGEPRVVNPDPRLRRRALELGWSIESWRAPKREILETLATASQGGGSSVGSGSR